MALFRVDFFEYDRYNRTLTNTHHDMVEDPVIDDDYIAVNTSSIDIQPTDLVSTGQFISLKGEYDFFGVVSSVSTKKTATTVSFKPFISVFDDDVLFNVKLQGRGTRSLESVLTELINKYYIYGAATDPDMTSYCTDRLQCLPLVIASSSSTTTWGFNLKPDVEGKNWCKCNLYNVILVDALKKYGIALTVTPHFHDTIAINGNSYHGYFTVQIGKPSVGLYRINANLDGVEVDTLQVEEKDGVVNKLIVFDTRNYLFSRAIYYYVHPDKTYSAHTATETITNRITPVVRRIESVSPEEETLEDGTVISADDMFILEAMDVAASNLSGLEWANLIELSSYATNTLVDPVGLPIGQLVEIFYRGNTYKSILTGKRYDTAVTLTFGSERILFTKRR